MSRKDKRDTGIHESLPLGRQNYILMLIGVGIIILGFILMIGDEDIYDFRKTTLAVLVVMFGFVLEIYAIIKRPKVEITEEQPPVVKK